MIGYLTRKYLAALAATTVLLILFPILFAKIPVLEAVRRGWFLATPIAAFLVYFEFRRHRIWPLYDNLGIPKYAVLAVLVGLSWGIWLVT